MPFGTASAGDLAKLIFQAIAFANIADDAGTDPLTDLYVALHTADPAPAGTQTTSEASYTGYARVAIPRTDEGFDVTGNVVSNIEEVLFPTSTSGPQTMLWFSVGTDAAGAGKILLRGALTASLIVNPGISPRFAPGVLSATFVTAS